MSKNIGGTWRAGGSADAPPKRGANARHLTQLRRITPAVALTLLALAASFDFSPRPASASAADEEELLLITTDAAPDVVVAGSNVTYAVTVTNEGSAPAAAFTLTEVLPAETAFVSCDGGGLGVCGGAGNNRTVEFSTLGPGESVTVTFVAAVSCPLPEGAELENTASLRSASPDPEDEEDENETAFTPVSNPPPSISPVRVSASSLWPSNHKMVDVAVNYQVTDNCGPVAVALRVTSNEPDNGTGDGDTAPDWVIVNPHLVRLRAERAGGGKGRVYTITVVATDSAGQSSSRSAVVAVPKSQRK